MATARTARPTLNFDAAEPTTTTDPNASALFPTQPVYARTSSRKSGGNLPLLIGVPVVAIVAGGLIWASTTNRTEAPTDQKSLKTAAAETTAPKTATPVPANVAETPAPIPKPTELASNTPVTKAPAPALRAAQPKAAVAARRTAARDRAADAESASANVSATVPATPPVAATPAPTPTVAAPPPLVIPPAAAPQPQPQAVPDTSNPM